MSKHGCKPGVTRWSSNDQRCKAIKKKCKSNQYRSSKTGRCRSRGHKCSKGFRWIKASKKSSKSGRMVGSCRKPCKKGKKRASSPNRKGLRLCSVSKR